MAFKMNSNSIPATRRFANYPEFWNYYLAEHRHPVNRALHVLGTLASIGCWGLAMFVSWKWALAAPLCSYGPAWIGHFLIERNRPASFSHPVWSLRADFEMVARILIGARLDASTQAGGDSEPRESRRVA
jgi:hypothetical protein